MKHRRRVPRKRRRNGVVGDDEDWEDVEEEGDSRVHGDATGCGKVQDVVVVEQREKEVLPHQRPSLLPAEIIVHVREDKIDTTTEQVIPEIQVEEKEKGTREEEEEVRPLSPLLQQEEEEEIEEEQQIEEEQAIEEEEELPSSLSPSPQVEKQHRQQEEGEEPSPSPLLNEKSPIKQRMKTARFANHIDDAKTTEVNAKESQQLRLPTEIENAPPPPPPQQQQVTIEEASQVLRNEEDLLRAHHKAAAGQSDTPTDVMYSECQQLLQLFGIPYLIAPAEAEAQAAWLDANGLADGVVTDDNDAFLFGAQRLYRNIFEDKKYVEEYRSDELERELGLSRERLVALALLLGSDYTPGVGGVGVVNAVEVVRAFEGEDGLERFGAWMRDGDAQEILKLTATMHAKKEGRNRRLEEDEDEEHEQQEEEERKAEKEFKKKHRNVRKTWQLPSNFPSQEVVDAYLRPTVDSCKDKFTFARPDVGLLRRFCMERFGWEQSRTDELLVPMLRVYDERQQQQTLDTFLSYREKFAKIRSKRLREAVSGITGRDVSKELGLDVDEDGEEDDKGRKKKASTTKKGAKRETARTKKRSSPSSVAAATANGRKRARAEICEEEEEKREEEEEEEED